MCFTKFLPLNLNICPSQRESEVKELYALFKPENNTAIKKHIYMEYLGISEKKAISLLKKKELSISMRSTELIRKINILKSLHPPAEWKEKHYWFLKTKLSTIQHRIMVMKELGMPQTCDNVLRFRNIAKRSIKDLQKRGMIYECTDLPGKIFRELHAPESVINMFPPASLYKYQELNVFLTELNEIYLMWQLQITREESKKLQTPTLITSLTYQHEIIKLLKKFLNFDSKKIPRHLGLLHGNPSEYSAFLESKKIFGGVSMIEAAKINPSIMKRPLEDIFILEHVFNYTNSRVVHGYIFTLHLKTILSRIAFFIRKTSLNDFRLTPNNMSYIYYFDNIKRGIREHELENGPIKYLPLLKKFKNDKYNLLFTKTQKSLNQIFEFYFGLSRPDCWSLAVKQIGLINIPNIDTYKSNFGFLLNKGFSVDVLKQAYHILFFPHDLVVKSYYELPETTKYAKLYQENNGMDKMIQLLLYKVYKNYQSLSTSLLIT